MTRDEGGGGCYLGPLTRASFLSSPAALPMPTLSARNVLLVSAFVAGMAGMAGLAACGSGPAFGSDNAVIAVVAPEVRDQVEPLIRRTFETLRFTTRPEPVFQVTFTTPAELGNFRRWERLIVVEPTTDPLLLPDLVDVPANGPVVARVEDEWARGQTIWVLGGETPAATVELVAAQVDSLYRQIYRRFARHHAERMWASGRDSALTGRLQDSLGFSILLPRVYQSAPGSAQPSTRVWYNQDPRRVVSLHWRPAPPNLTADTVLAVRRDWGHQVFPGDSLMLGGDSIPSGPSAPRVSEARLGGRPAVRIQGVWHGADGGAGVFLTYGLICGDRLVLLDGNLYAPDRNKIPYLLQLERIFDTFRCGRA